MNIPPRTLRAANALLYATSVLLIIAAIIYCAMYKELASWQLWGGIALSLGGAIWGAYYVTLCYRISPEGITRHVYLRRTRLLRWKDIERAELKETDVNSIATCTITLHPKTGTPLRLSSDVLTPDDVQELAADLRQIGLLPPAETKDEK